ncbi:MAG: Bacillibactin exporter [Chroococcidiopsis sp. SAG 2025]|uniref:MFS transporter n=1 Tax=Chroococcidiopsis sp. SAG 2025 TaxID=171389 RepID=UPI0029370938|nr:MFS transporter [Chroococcidiopsis sp. SAG 2025]MDV2996939.1 Bacillibactin exporter [Chroococcidiopsis sp. SAG 2025]
MKPPQANRFSQPSNLYFDRNFQIICAVSLVAVLGVSSVTPAFPALAQALKIAPQNIGLLVTVFTLPTLLLGPVIGVFADRLGRKKILIPALFLFAIAGAACAIAPNLSVLLVLRCLQGIGAAPLLSLSLTLIGDFYVGDQRATAMGYNSSISSVGTAIYPTLGGALAVWGWYYPFLLPLVAIPIGLLVILMLRNREQKSGRSLKAYLNNASRVLKNRQLLGLFIGSAANFMLLYGTYITYLPELINQSFNASAFAIGLILSSVSVSITLASSQLGRLTHKFPAPLLVRASFIFYAVALLIIPFVSSLWFLLIPTTLFGIGVGIGMPSIQTLLAELAPQEYLATVMAVNGSFFGLGQTLGPLITGVAFGVAGINGAFFTGVGLALVMLIVFRFCGCLGSSRLA